MATPNNPAKLLDGMLAKLLKQIEEREASAQAHLQAADSDMQQAKVFRARHERLTAAQKVIEEEASGGAPVSPDAEPVSPMSMARFVLESPRLRRAVERPRITTSFKDQVLAVVEANENPQGITAAEVSTALGRDERNTHVSQRVLYSMTYVALRRLAEAGVLVLERGERGAVFSKRRGADK